MVADSAGPAGQDVEVAISNGFSGGYQLYRNGGPDSSFGNDTTVGACYTATHTYADLTAGTYYLVAKGTSVAGGAAQQPLQVSIRDLDGVGAIACTDGTSASPATINSTTLASPIVNAQGELPIGTYYAAFSGQASNNGAYELVFSDQTQGAGSSATLIDCETDQDLTASLAANTDYYVVVKGDTAAARGAYSLAVSDVTAVQDFDVACPTDVAAPDGYAAFTLTSARDVTVDMSGSVLDGAFQVFNSNGTTVAGCACSDIGTPQTCSLGAGTYYVAYRGNAVAGGLGQQPFELVLRDQDALGAITCRNGAVATGRTITQALNAGTYYVGIVPTAANSSADFDYRLMIKDQASTVGTGAPEIGCSESEILADVVGGEDYYVVVKGKNAGDRATTAWSCRTCRVCRRSGAATTRAPATRSTRSRHRERHGGHDRHRGIGARDRDRAVPRRAERELRRRRGDQRDRDGAARRQAGRHDRVRFEQRPDGQLLADRDARPG